MLNLHDTPSPAGRDLKRRLIEAEERERNRVARELHDDIGQQLVTLSMDIARLREMLPAQSDARALTTTLRDQVLILARGIQGISRRLHSPKIDVMGLAGAAGSLCQELTAQYRVDISYSHEGVPTDLPCDVALHLYRVLQEALANAIKHSGARHHIVTLRGTAEHEGSPESCERCCCDRVGGGTRDTDPGPCKFAGTKKQPDQSISRTPRSI